MSTTPDLQTVAINTFTRDAVDAKTAEQLSIVLQGCSVKYLFQESSTTIAVLVDTKGVFVSVGVSKRNPEDKPNTLRGKALALTRAIRNMYHA